MRVWVGVVLSLVVGAADAAELRDVRIWEGPDSTRVVFDLDGPAEHRLFTLSGPERIVIDLPATRRNTALTSQLEGKGIVQRVRSAQRDGGATLRVVLDVSEEVNPKSFSLPPNDSYGHRLVVDLYGARPAARPAPPPVRTLAEKPIIIAIDAGHGGEDPGAIARNGLREKDVALAIARRLARLVDQEPGLRAVMIRDGDYYIGLRDRIEKARAAQADLFVSVHANSYKDRHVRGTAIYVLSRRGASSEHARWVASRENMSDLIGGVEVNSKDDTLAAVLIDISQTSAIEASFDVGGRLLESMGTVNPLQKPEVQQAAFAVLKAPDIPSILVETAFLSNDEEARLLGTPAYQEKLAQAMLRGIKGYFQNYRPRQQLVAQPASPGGGLHPVALEAAPTAR
jgi:N-acetylmuramoyl-L-alanine amidase